MNELILNSRLKNVFVNYRTCLYQDNVISIESLGRPVFSSKEEIYIENKGYMYMKYLHGDCLVKDIDGFFSNTRGWYIAFKDVCSDENYNTWNPLNVVINYKDISLIDFQYVISKLDYGNLDKKDIAHLLNLKIRDFLEENRNIYTRYMINSLYREMKDLNSVYSYFKSFYSWKVE